MDVTNLTEFGKSYFERFNVPKVIQKALVTDEIELPDGVEDKEEFLKSELKKWEDQQMELVKERDLKPLVDAEVQAKQSDWFIATKKSALGSAAKFYPDLDKEALSASDKNINDIIRSIHEINEEKKKEWTSTIDDKSKNLLETVNDQKKQIQEYAELQEKMKNDHLLELQRVREEEAQKNNKNIFQREFSSFTGDLLPKLSAAKVGSAKDLLEGAYRRNGYKIDVVNNSDGTTTLVAKNSDGSAAMNLAKTKLVSLEELSLELAAKEGFLKQSKTVEKREEIVMGITPVKNKKGEIFKPSTPAWMLETA